MMSDWNLCWRNLSWLGQFMEQADAGGCADWRKLCEMDLIVRDDQSK